METFVLNNLIVVVYFCWVRWVTMWLANMGDSVVLEALRAATSQDPELLKRGENLLKSWEGQAGFYRTLSVLFMLLWRHRYSTLLVSGYFYQPSSWNSS